jgi:hypothetical protein
VLLSTVDTDIVIHWNHEFVTTVAKPKPLKPDESDSVCFEIVNIDARLSIPANNLKTPGSSRIAVLPYFTYPDDWQ